MIKQKLNEKSNKGNVTIAKQKVLQSYDHYMPEKRFIRPGVNLEAETIGQLKAALSKEENWDYHPGIHTNQARVDYIRERLRLLYVGITRARKELFMSWNSGRLGDLYPAAPLDALRHYLNPTGESL